MRKESGTGSSYKVHNCAMPAKTNLPLGVSTRSDTIGVVWPQKIAGGFNFQI